MALEKVNGQFALAFDFNGATGFKVILAPQAGIGGFGDLDFANHAVGFHAAGNVDGVAPECRGGGYMVQCSNLFFARESVPGHLLNQYQLPFG